MRSARIFHLVVACVGMVVALTQKESMHYVVIGAAMYAANTVVAALIFLFGEGREKL